MIKYTYEWGISDDLLQSSFAWQSETLTAEMNGAYYLIKHLLQHSHRCLSNMCGSICVPHLSAK